MRYIITGGAGFIGCNIARELIRRRHKVKIIDNLSTGKLENIADFKNKAEFIKADIKNLGLLKKEFKSYDVVLHHAALRAVQKTVVDPLSANENNITGFLNVLEAARHNKLKRVIFASSSAVYGDGAKIKNIETDTPNPQSPYALTKLTGEYYCRLFWQLYGLPTISLRYFNVYGPYQNPESKYSAVIPIFVNQLLKNKRPTIYGTGEQTRDFVYIDDVVQSNILALKAPKNAFGQAFNIGAGKSIAINKLFKILQATLGKNKIEPIYTNPLPGDISKTEADISQAQKMLGFKAQIKIEEGLRKYVDKLTAK